MIKADLFRTEVKVIDEEIFITIFFKEIARYSTNTLVEKDIPLKEYLDFIEVALANKGDYRDVKLEGSLTLMGTKTSVRLVCGEYYLPFKNKDLYNIATSEIEKLLIKGVIRI